jgi:hypothetical protein
MRLGRTLVLGVALVAATACSSTSETEGEGVGTDPSALSGCAGKASSSVPPSGNYYLTSFGGGSDTQGMSCGGRADGKWYYAASRQRFGCGSHIRIEAHGKCVVAQTDDYGPDVCVENAAGRPIIDASPLVAKALFGTTSAGWSDHFAVHATLVAKSTPLGPCAPAPPPDVAPRGQLDSADCTAIAGWAQDPDKPASAVGVTITVDGPLTKAGVTKIATKANVARADLCAPLGSCNHGFSVKPPASLADGKAHTIYVYGVDTESASKTKLLENAPKTITCAPPVNPAPPAADAGAPASDPPAGAPDPTSTTDTTSEDGDPPAADPSPSDTGAQDANGVHGHAALGGEGGCRAAPRAASPGDASLLLAVLALRFRRKREEQGARPR